MIEETRYRCEICSKVHLSDLDAAECEAMHTRVCEITGQEYKRGAVYPRFITVRFDNGKEAMYSNISILTTGEPEDVKDHRS